MEVQIELNIQGVELIREAVASRAQKKATEIQIIVKAQKWEYRNKPLSDPAGQFKKNLSAQDSDYAYQIESSLNLGWI